MKKFDFPLERVRLWRHEQADIEELKLQKLMAELRGIDEIRARVEDEGTDAERETRSHPQVTAEDLANLDGFRQYIQRRLTQIAQSSRDCEQRIQQQRHTVMESRRRFELLDRLKQKSLAEWRATASKEEEELAAELFLAKRRRDTSGAGF